MYYLKIILILIGVSLTSWNFGRAYTYELLGWYGRANSMFKIGMITMTLTLVFFLFSRILIGV